MAFPSPIRTGRPKAQTAGTDPGAAGGTRRIQGQARCPAAQHRLVLRTEAVELGCAGDLMPARDLVTLRIDPLHSGAPSG